MGHLSGLEQPQGSAEWEGCENFVFLHKDWFIPEYFSFFPILLCAQLGEIKWHFKMVGRKSGKVGQEKIHKIDKTVPNLRSRKTNPIFLNGQKNKGKWNINFYSDKSYWLRYPSHLKSVYLNNLRKTKVSISYLSSLAVVSYH